MYFNLLENLNFQFIIYAKRFVEQNKQIKIHFLLQNWQILHQRYISKIAQMQKRYFVQYFVFDL